jgi:c-di-GMP-binding flagellar brake protein YcgR
MDKDAFQLITDSVEKEKLFLDLATARAEIVFKGVTDNLIVTECGTYNWKSKILDCRPKDRFNLKEGEEYLGHFFIGGQKYYFQGTAHVVNGAIMIPVPAELYLLQRRQNYRVNIPANYLAYFNTLTVNGRKEQLHCRLLDFASQGCRFEYRAPSPIIKLSDLVTGQLAIGPRDAIDLTAVVRHLKTETDANGPIQSCGIEFQNLTGILENKLFAITMELHKEIFKRY